MGDDPGASSEEIDDRKKMQSETSNFWKLMESFDPIVNTQVTNTPI
jgi:predicted component of type VI protein secretion system